MTRASQLEGRILRTEDGRRIGALHDLRFIRVGSGTEITHLVYGRRGLLERLGFKGERYDSIAWTHVVAVRPHEIIVRGV